MTNTKCMKQQEANLSVVKNAAKDKLAVVGDDKKYPEIGERLGRVRRAFSDLPRVGWADQLGFNRPQYIHWENGTRRIPIEAAEKLCDLYGLSLDFIYRGRLEGCSASAIKALSGSSLT